MQSGFRAWRTSEGLVDVGGEVDGDDVADFVVVGRDEQGAEEALGRVMQQLPVAAIVCGAPRGRLWSSTPSQLVDRQ